MKAKADLNHDGKLDEKEQAILDFYMKTIKKMKNIRQSI